MADPLLSLPLKLKVYPVCYMHEHRKGREMARVTDTVTGAELLAKQ